jgi:hypothetical protein
MREGFRNFNIARMNAVEVLEPFPDVSGRRLADYLRHVNAPSR